MLIDACMLNQVTHKRMLYSAVPDNMPITKTTNYGSMTVTPHGARITIQEKNGVTTSYLRPARPTYIRRIGKKASITSHTGNDGRFRPCSHSQENYIVRPLSSLSRIQQYTDLPGASPSTQTRIWLYDLNADAHAARYTQFTTACNQNVLSLNSVPWGALSSTALQNMLPSFNAGENSLVNFILELKDFKDVWKYVAGGFVRKIDRMNAFRVKGRDGRERSLMVDMDRNKPLQKLSKYYLGYNFGWRPLYNDVVSLVQSLTSFQKTYDELVQRQNRPQQRYWGQWIAGTATNEVVRYERINGPNGGWIGVFQGHSRVRVVQEKTDGIRYHATLRYRYKLPSELFSTGGKVKSFLDLLGVSRNPAILWNAIPFSFIIDWVVNVGQYLERLKVDNIQIQTELLDFCHSARIERSVRMDLQVDNCFKPSPYSYMAMETSDVCTKREYQRRVGIPDFRTAIATSGLSLREFSLAGALMGARRGY